jgi:hypothetical protein
VEPVSSSLESTLSINRLAAFQTLSSKGIKIGHYLGPTYVLSFKAPTVYIESTVLHESKPWLGISYFSESNLLGQAQESKLNGNDWATRLYVRLTEGQTKAPLRAELITRVRPFFTWIT